MKLDTYPLAIPSELLADVRAAAKETGLSMADMMRLSIKVGLPKVVEQLSVEFSGLKPFTDEECRRCWGPGSEDPEFDTLAAAMVSRPMAPPAE